MTRGCECRSRVGRVSDQYSDLTGGYADRTFKMPNPNYFLP
jgi:hypothetical protein